MLFQELNRGNCKTYVIGCEKTRKAALIDPLRERVDRYLAFLAYHGYRHRLDHDRPRVDQSRLRKVADVDAAIEAGLADLDRYPDVGGNRGNGNYRHHHG